jgi:hypothetical protein
MRAVHGVLAFEMCLAGFCRAFPALAAPDLSFCSLLRCVRIVFCVYVMARCCASYGLMLSDLAVFRPCVLMFVSVPASVRLQSGSVV